MWRVFEKKNVERFDLEHRRRGTREEVGEVVVEARGHYLRESKVDARIGSSPACGRGE